MHFDDVLSQHNNVAIIMSHTKDLIICYKHLDHPIVLSCTDKVQEMHSLFLEETQVSFSEVSLLSSCQTFPFKCLRMM